MEPEYVKAARLKRGWSQEELAARLGVSQPYVALLEGGARPLAGKLGRKVASVLKLSPVTLPYRGLLEKTASEEAAQVLARELGALGYPGFGYAYRGGEKKNPAEVMLVALAQQNLEARVVEGLPWVMAAYPDMDTKWLQREAMARGLQNRLGFVVALAKQLAERRFPDSTAPLTTLEATLYKDRLAREDTLCRAGVSPVEAQWLRENRSEAAARWNVLSDWTVESLRYVAN